MIVSGELPCSKEEAVTLAGIQLHIQKAWPEEDDDDDDDMHSSRSTTDRLRADDDDDVRGAKNSSSSFLCFYFEVCCRLGDIVLSGHTVFNIQCHRLTPLKLNWVPPTDSLRT